MKRLLCLVALCTAAAGVLADEPLRIGSKRFTESYILAQLMAQAAAPKLPTAPEVKQGLGNTAIVYEALRSGSIDMYPEYAGTIALEILKSPKPMELQAMNQALAPLGLGAAIPLGFNDGYALAMRAADAKRLGIETLSDLARHPQLRLGLSNEFIGRADGWKGLAAHYGLRAGAHRAGPRPGLRRHRRRAGGRDRHLHHRRQDRPPGPRSAAGRQSLLSALRRAGAVPAGRAAALSRGLGRAAAAGRPHRRGAR